MLFFTKKSRYNWEGAVLKERTYGESNPGKGWYYIHTFVLDENLEVFPPVIYGQERLALVLVNIGRYRQEKITDEALIVFERILKSFVDAGLDMILRVSYDTEGRGMEREPSLFSLVQDHISQLVPIMNKYAAYIHVYQGLLVGNWGEMHGSKFLNPMYFPVLFKTFYDCVGGAFPVALRQPVQYRQLIAEGAKQEGIGFFNDAILASETCMGTYAPMARPKGQWTEQWNFTEEAAFMKEYANEVPFGGEALSGNENLKPAEVVERLGQMRLNYLNAAYDDKLLDSWKKIVYEGTTLFEYVGRRMGYHLLVESVCWKHGKDESELKIDLVNRGFASFRMQAKLCLYLAVPGQTPASYLEFQKPLTYLQEEEKASFSVKLSIGEWMSRFGTNKLDCYLGVCLKETDKVLLLGQEYAGDYLFLGSVESLR